MATRTGELVCILRFCRKLAKKLERQGKRKSRKGIQHLRGRNMEPVKLVTRRGVGIRNKPKRGSMQHLRIREDLSLNLVLIGSVVEQNEHTDGHDGEFAWIEIGTNAWISMKANIQKRTTCKTSAVDNIVMFWVCKASCINKKEQKQQCHQ